MIQHANSQRNTSTNQTNHADEILISPEWQQQLEAIPFISSKSYAYSYDLLINREPGQDCASTKAVEQVDQATLW